jgi:hypothetical protein
MEVSTVESAYPVLSTFFTDHLLVLLKLFVEIVEVILVVDTDHKFPFKEVATIETLFAF